MADSVSCMIIYSTCRLPKPGQAATTTDRTRYVKYLNSKKKKEIYRTLCVFSWCLCTHAQIRVSRLHSTLTQPLL